MQAFGKRYSIKATRIQVMQFTIRQYQTVIIFTRLRISQGSRLSNAKEYVEPPAFDVEEVRTFLFF